MKKNAVDFCYIWSLYFSVLMGVFTVFLAMTVNCEWCVGTIHTMTREAWAFPLIFSAVGGGLIALAWLVEDDNSYSEVDWL